LVERDRLLAERVDELEAQLAEKNERLHALAVELRPLEDRV
jgi:predicted nuclease with TOPRIM domain